MASPSASNSTNGEIGPEYERLLHALQSCFNLGGERAIGLNARILELEKQIDKGPASSATSIESDYLSTTFWNMYKKIADEYDKEFTEMSRSELENSLIFAGLFSAVVTAFVALVLTISDHLNFWLLSALRSLLYLVLATIMAAALFAVLGLQYLMTYSTIRKGGTIAERADGGVACVPVGIVAFVVVFACDGSESFEFRHTRES
ncbi:hypothetical protein B0H13DRAFT_1879425 [Mycena leptocephala]|nr:hypothetical protein B0H13DRAFT_1879425 [Mycena leptocephala]